MLDTRSLTVAKALTVGMLSSGLTPALLEKTMRDRGRIAMVISTGGHFASAAAAAVLRRGPGRQTVSVFPVQTPMPDLVARLNTFRPAILAPYASTGGRRAYEQESGRLNIQPSIVILSAEGLPAAERARISASFGLRSLKATPRPNALSLDTAAKKGGSMSTAAGPSSNLSMHALSPCPTVSPHKPCC